MYIFISTYLQIFCYISPNLHKFEQKHISIVYIFKCTYKNIFILKYIYISLLKKSCIYIYIYLQIDLYMSMYLFMYLSVCLTIYIFKNLHIY